MKEPAVAGQTVPTSCLITGASPGLGRALAEECARGGMNLILVALADTGLAEAAGTLRRRYGVAVRYREIDLTEPDSPDALHRWIGQQRLAVNLLINNAGIGSHGPFSESELERNRAMIALNICALVQLTRLFLPELMRHPQAYILNVASLAAFYPMPYKPIYAPTKAFVLNFSLALRAELTGASVTVSALCPGGILSNEECRKLIAAQGFIGKISCHHPEEVARYALGQMLRHKAVIIPGLINKVARIVGVFVPLSLTQLFIRSRFGNSGNRGRSDKNRNLAPLLETGHE